MLIFCICSPTTYSKNPTATVSLLGFFVAVNGAFLQLGIFFCLAHLPITHSSSVGLSLHCSRKWCQRGFSLLCAQLCLSSSLLAYFQGAPGTESSYQAGWGCAPLHPCRLSGCLLCLVLLYSSHTWWHLITQPRAGLYPLLPRRLLFSFPGCLFNWLFLVCSYTSSLGH